MKVVEELQLPFDFPLREPQDERERGAGVDWGFEPGLRAWSLDSSAALGMTVGRGWLVWSRE